MCFTIPWFKTIIGISQDTKLYYIAEKTNLKPSVVGWTWIAILDEGAKHDGSLAGFYPTVVDRLNRLKKGTVQKILDAMIELDMIEDGMISNWGKYQKSFSSDSNQIKKDPVLSQKRREAAQKRWGKNPVQDANKSSVPNDFDANNKGSLVYKNMQIAYAKPMQNVQFASIDKIDKINNIKDPPIVPQPVSTSENSFGERESFKNCCEEKPERQPSDFKPTDCQEGVPSDQEMVATLGSEKTAPGKEKAERETQLENPCEDIASFQAPKAVVKERTELSNEREDVKASRKSRDRRGGRRQSAKEKVESPEFQEQVFASFKEFTPDTRLQRALEAYFTFRLGKSPISTVEGWKRACGRLQGLCSGNVESMISHVHYAQDRGWLDFYLMPNEKNTSYQPAKEQTPISKPAPKPAPKPELSLEEEFEQRRKAWLVMCEHEHRDPGDEWILTPEKKEQVLRERKISKLKHSFECGVQFETKEAAGVRRLGIAQELKKLGIFLDEKAAKWGVYRELKSPVKTEEVSKPVPSEPVKSALPVDLNMQSMPTNNFRQYKSAKEILTGMFSGRGEVESGCD